MKTANNERFGFIKIFIEFRATKKVKKNFSSRSIPVTSALLPNF